MPKTIEATTMAVALQNHIAQWGPLPNDLGERVKDMLADELSKDEELAVLVALMEEEKKQRALRSSSAS